MIDADIDALVQCLVPIDFLITLILVSLFTLFLNNYVDYLQNLILTSFFIITWRRFVYSILNSVACFINISFVTLLY